MRTFFIYTEDKNRSQIEAMLSEQFDGFTLLFGQGFWRGLREVYRENSLIVVLLTNDARKVKGVAEEIKKLNNQESVLVASWKTEMEMI